MSDWLEVFEVYFVLIEKYGNCLLEGFDVIVVFGGDGFML